MCVFSYFYGVEQTIELDNNEKNIEIFDRLIDRLENIAKTQHPNSLLCSKNNWPNYDEYHNYYKCEQAFNKAKEWFSINQNHNKILISLYPDEKKILSELVNALFWMTDQFDESLQHAFPTKEFLSLFLNQYVDESVHFSDTVKSWFSYFLNACCKHFSYIDKHELLFKQLYTMQQPHSLFSIKILACSGCTNFFDRYRILYKELERSIDKLLQYVNSDIVLEKDGYKKSSTCIKDRDSLRCCLQDLKKMINEHSTNEASYVLLHENLVSLWPSIINAVWLCFKNFLTMPFFKDYSIKKSCKNTLSGLNVVDVFPEFLDLFKDDILKRTIRFCKPYIDNNLLTEEDIRVCVIEKTFDNYTDFKDIVSLCRTNFYFLLIHLMEFFDNKVLNPLHLKTFDPYVAKRMTSSTMYKNVLKFINVKVWHAKDQTISDVPYVPFLDDNNCIYPYEKYCTYKEHVEKYTTLVSWIEKNKAALFNHHYDISLLKNRLKAYNFDETLQSFTKKMMEELFCYLYSSKSLINFSVNGLNEAHTLIQGLFKNGTTIDDINKSLANLEFCIKASLYQDILKSYPIIFMQDVQSYYKSHSDLFDTKESLNGYILNMYNQRYPKFCRVNKSMKRLNKSMKQVELGDAKDLMPWMAFKVNCIALCNICSKTNSVYKLLL